MTDRLISFLKVIAERKGEDVSQVDRVLVQESSYQLQITIPNSQSSKNVGRYITVAELLAYLIEIQ